MKKKKYTREEFCELAGINNRSRLHQVMKGSKSKGYEYPPLLIEGEDYVKTEYVFFESALKKLQVCRTL